MDNDDDDNEYDDDSVNVDVNKISDDSLGVGGEETMDDDDTADDSDDDTTDGPKTRDLEEMEDGVTTEDTEYSLDR